MAEQAQSEVKRTKERSANYPSMSLPEALKKVAAIYDKEKRSPMPLEVAGRNIGYSSLSGPCRSAISALKKYDLLQEVGSGQVRLSDDAIVISVYKEGSSEREQAIRRCALKPEIFRETLKDFPDGIESVSEDNLKARLITQKGFTEGGAATFIKALKETVRLAKIDKLGESASDAESDETAEGGDMEQEEALRPLSLAAKDPARFTEKMSKVQDQELLRYMLSGERGVRLLFTGPRPTQEQIDELIELLRVNKRSFPSSDASNTPQARGTANRDQGSEASPESSGGTETLSETQMTPVEDAVARVSMFITNAQKVQLRARGHTDAEIALMKPAEAHKILGLMN